MIEQMIQMMKELSASDEYFQETAKIYRKLYKALQTAGFSQEEALKIVANMKVGG